MIKRYVGPVSKRLPKDSIPEQIIIQRFSLPHDGLIIKSKEWLSLYN
jgi:hypothetical protein